MIGLHIHKKARGTARQSKTREIPSIYGPVFWELKAPPHAKKPHTIKHYPNFLPSASVLRSQIPSSVLESKTCDEPGSIETLSIDTSEVNRTDLRNTSKNNFMRRSEPKMGRRTIISLVPIGQRSATPGVDFATRKRKSVPSPRVRLPDRSKSSTRVKKTREGSETFEANPSPWGDAAFFDPVSSPLAIGEYEYG